MACVLTLACTVAAAEDLILACGEETAYKIRLCEDPTLAEKTAANAILVGRDAVSDRLCEGLVLDKSLEELGQEGLVVAAAGRHLILAGGRPRGTIYAVYSFLDQELGCRWFTDEAIRVPKQNPLVIPSSLNRTYVPQFEYRDLYTPLCYTDWSPHNFLNGRYETEPYGGAVEYAGFYVHTFYLFLPPGQYFADHPEWYTWLPEGAKGYGLGKEGIDYVREVSGGVQGERYHKNHTTGLPGQLCLTNPAVVEAVTRKVREWLRDPKNQGAKIISVSQNDSWYACQCANCLASDKREEPPDSDPRCGGRSGTQLNFVNRIADNIRGEFPDVFVDTLAYHATLDVPLHARPRPNVIIRLCTHDCYLHAYTTDKCGFNKKFVAEMEAWKKVWSPGPPHLYVWEQIGGQSLVPCPNLSVLEKNIKFFRDSGVTGIFAADCAGDDRPGAEMTVLRSYIYARLLWNPDYNGSDPNFARDEFVDFYYGPAAAPFKEYLTLIESKLPGFEWQPAHRWGFNWNSGSYLPPKVLSKAWEIFDRAEQAVAAGPPEFRKRLRTARLPIQYVILKRGPDGGWWTDDLEKHPDTGKWRWVKNHHTPTFRETPVGSGNYVPWTNKKLAQRFLAAAAEIDYPLRSFRDELISRYGIDRKIIFLDPPAGTPGSVIKGGTVQCTAEAQYILAKRDTPDVTYLWTTAEGSFEDTGTATSTMQNPR